MKKLRFSEPEIRVCARCGDEFEHFDWLSPDGKPITGLVADEEGQITAETDESESVYCDPCIEQLNEDLKREQERRARIERCAKRWESAVPAVYRETKKDYPGFSLRLLAQSMSWSRGEIPLNRRKEPLFDELRLFFGLIGESGRCKTRVLALVAKQLIWEEKGIFWINSSQYQWCCQNQFGEHSKKAQAVLERCLRTPYLFFDDIGSLKSSGTVVDNLYALLEQRTAGQRPMLWTSNETISEMLAGDGITEKARKRNLSRLSGFSNILEI
ncbi:hypothetical protein [Roseibacillus ishigakijimensis]|uniref:hypothetical protein n=1 Tax=Roseibacillus ishigakijimensis TaxID=454146 RepID=UPI001903A736|nr:hypothetical protein [Roseibacillus ishigakijimensis]